MKSRHVTFILRMRFEPVEVDPPPHPSVHGSIQQVGQDQIHHFDSLEKFLDLFREKVGQAILLLGNSED